MRRTKGFTLIELLVVIAIIGLLVSILVPSIAQAQRLAKRVACLSNLNGIGKTFVLYKGMNDEVWPFIYQNSNGIDGDAALTGTSSTTLGLGSVDALHVTENLNLLVSANLAPWKMFLCPGQGGSTMKRTADTQKYGFYDGSSEIFLHYAYHNGYRVTLDAANPAALNDNLDQGVPILGDQPNEGYAVNLDNSAVNHGEDGICLLFAGNNAAWHSKDALGGYGDDNVYTAEGGGNTPGNDKDSVLIKAHAGGTP